MAIEFLGQPFTDEHEAGNVLRNALTRADAEHFLAITAWAKASGLRRLGSSIENFNYNGGHSVIVLGVDEGGATREGLGFAHELFHEAYVFHDRGSRTFHPKLYMVEGNSWATIVVGSSNVTMGGLYTNYEVSLAVHLEQGDADYVHLIDEVHEYYRKLGNHPEAFQQLTEEVIDQLESDPQVIIHSERHARRPDGPGERRGSGQTEGGLFGAPVTGLSNAPAPGLEPPPGGEDDRADDDSMTSTFVAVDRSLEDEEAPQAPSEPSRVTGFWKRLSQSNGSHTSSPGQIIIPRRFGDFFPEMDVEIDRTEQGGTRQLASYFPVDFYDGDYHRRVEEARAIRYEPATYHPRPNIEYRFAFRDAQVFNRLQPGDILMFKLNEDGDIEVRRLPSDARTGNFGDI